MSRITQINPEAATGKSKELLEAVKSKLGLVPNMTRAMATAPAVLEGYLQFSGSLSHGKLSPKVREQLALVVGQENQCDYCLAAHTAIGKMVGLTSEQILDSRVGRAIDAQTGALLNFAKIVVRQKGRINDADIETMRNAGFDEGIIAEVIANVALNIFTNYFNHVAGTDIDFPKAADLHVKQLSQVA